MLFDGGRFIEGGLLRGGLVDVGRSIEGGLFVDGGLFIDGGLFVEGGRLVDGGLLLDRGRFIILFGKWGVDVDVSVVCISDWFCNFVLFVLFEFMFIGLFLEVINFWVWGFRFCFFGSCGWWDNGICG